jgi:hypothetical protein
MNFNDLTKIWESLESQMNYVKGAPFRLICPESLYRIYIGCLGETQRRTVLFELPEEDARAIKQFTPSTGIQCYVRNTHNEKAGYTSCFLVSSTHENNSIFALVLSDILSHVVDKKTNPAYLKALQQRVETWKDFFKTAPSQKLSHEAELGLWGELYILKELLENGFSNSITFWNGPIKAAQDYQFENASIEIKTNQGDSQQVKISSEDQLEAETPQLFLGLLNVQLSGPEGLTLPALIEEIEKIITDEFLEQFQAKLTCAGYYKQHAALYGDRFTVKQQTFFRIDDNFPKLSRKDIPKNISHVRYKMDLSSCESFQITLVELLDVLRNTANAS